ncbi:uncharacterized protein LOC128228245 isoform X2 [Mya arenaria]|nr:uncharacterized protein LOC128228245 isoform X2 [Mya arenaria]XP_052795386.1 uncharacterized protein LOC128228245 isoform X2 [Mya arenaria]
MEAVGEDLQRTNMHGNTAMHYAARGGYLDLVRYLKHRKCALNPLNQLEGDAPLHKAILSQTMDVIETLVDLGMDPNVKNKLTGDTPLHTALATGAQEAMEGLLIKGANTAATNNEKKRPEDVAKNSSIRENLRMYATLLIAMSAGYIQAKGMKISRRQVEKAMKIERVGVIITKFDIPGEFPTGFYCRREKAENSSMSLPQHAEETVLSDVFHIRVFEVNKDCPAVIHLPLYKAPSEKEQMVLRFINCKDEDRSVEACVTENKVHYCPLEVVLVPETNCVCVVFLRPRREENRVCADEGTSITSDMEQQFRLDVTAGTFEEDTVLSLQVYETHDEGGEESVEELEPGGDQPGGSGGKAPDKPASRGQMKSGKSDSRTSKTKAVRPPPVVQNPNLLTDVYQINVQGKQPKKGVHVQIPMCAGMRPDDEIAVVCADEGLLEASDEALEVLPLKPRVVDCNIIFEVTHFSIYVATWKKKVGTSEERQQLQRQISSAREKRRPAAFFTVIRKDDTDPAGRRHILVVECVQASRSDERRARWLERDYDEQNPPETGAIMMTPGDTFFVDVIGNSSLEDKSDSTGRRLQFSQCRSSFQAFRIILHDGIYDADQAFGHVVISQKTDEGLEEAARLRVRLTPPPPPPKTPTSAIQDFSRKQADHRPPRSVSDTILGFLRLTPRSSTPAASK